MSEIKRSYETSKEFTECSNLLRHPQEIVRDSARFHYILKDLKRSVKLYAQIVIHPLRSSNVFGEFTKSNETSLSSTRSYERLRDSRFGNLTITPGLLRDLQRSYEIIRDLTNPSRILQSLQKSHESPRFLRKIPISYGS
eukprot:8142314-Pyramimonas_sp.AAC.1